MAQFIDLGEHVINVDNVTRVRRTGDDLEKTVVYFGHGSDAKDSADHVVIDAKAAITLLAAILPGREATLAGVSSSVPIKRQKLKVL